MALEAEGSNPFIHPLFTSLSELCTRWMYVLVGKMAELVDALDLESSRLFCGGSSPPFPTLPFLLKNAAPAAFFLLSQYFYQKEIACNIN